MLVSAWHGPGYDLVPIVAAARLIEQEQSGHIYAQDQQFYNRVDDPVFRSAALEAGFTYEPTPFVYPPLIAALMQPLAAVSFAAVAVYWAIASAILILLGLYFTMAVYVPHWNRPLAWTAILLALCAFEPLLYAFWLGQTTAMIFPLVMGSVLLQRRGHLATAGVMLAFATFIKITPAVIAIVWLWRGPRKAMIWCAIVLFGMWGLSVAAVGVGLHLTYLERLSAIARSTVVAYNNHSVIAFVARFWFSPGEWLDWRLLRAPLAATVLTAAVTGAGLLVGASALARIPVKAEDKWRPYSEAFAILCMLLIPNIAWTHYFVFLLPPIAVVLSESPRARVPCTLVSVGYLLCCRPFLAAQSRVPAIGDSATGLSMPTLATAAAACALFYVTYEAGTYSSLKQAPITRISENVAP
jgi:hypothetical protein